MLPVAQALRQVKAEVEQRVTEYPIEPQEARHSILMMGGEVQGGVNFNVVPESFSFTVDRRINPEEDFDREKRRLLEAIDADVDVFQEARPAGVSEADPAAVALAIAEVRGEPAAFELCPGILEIRFYAERGVRWCSALPSRYRSGRAFFSASRPLCKRAARVLREP